MHMQLLAVREESDSLVTYSMGELSLVQEQAVEPCFVMVEGDAVLTMEALQSTKQHTCTQCS